MLGFLFKQNEKKTPKDAGINEIYSKLKEIYKFDEISPKRKSYLRNLVETYQYLPYPYIKALEELSPAEILFGLETKWQINKVFDGEKFYFDNEKISVLARNEIKNSNWIKKEGHDIKLINLAGLGNGNAGKEPGKFIDWLCQLLVLPGGNLQRNIFATTIYLIPFHPREFGCAYLPKSSEVSPNLEDADLKEALGLDAKAQVQTFITLAQLAGHPVIYDILPQTGRFAKVVLANPEITRWFNVNELMGRIQNSLETIAVKLEKKYDKEDIEIVKNIYKQACAGELSKDYQAIYDEFEEELDELKKSYSNEMLKKENQVKLQKRIREIVTQVHGEKVSKQFSEDEIVKQMDVIQALMQEGLWSAPGGAWCSAGGPVFDKMSDCKSYPIFKHYDFEGKEVSEFANLDCQTPFYFAFLENGQLNKSVIDFFIKFMQKLREDYNFDGFRVDHADHIVDEVSEKNGMPISYRVPREVLAKLNTEMKTKIPYFASLAEYMLGGGFLKEYHEDMKFDVLWGDDIPAQFEKTPEKIVDDNQNLATYNTKNFKTENLSILKTYNNQDGEFSVIDQYPGQLGKEGALFKWFKYKFLPGGKNAQRPVLYVDGDESFTKTGIERTIGAEVSMIREKNYEFFAKFDAISRFAKSQELVTEGEAQIILQDEEGFACWLISKEPLKSALLVAANYLNLPENEDENNEISDKSINLPGDFDVISEFIFDGENFVEKPFKKSEHSLCFKKLKPSEFKVFLLTK
ncbi:MAG: hypothetical protein PHC64_04440 [Candidatus Gastranaerophilales bacterium]|nr:hypothetical protein [Candidatus Gastranaerophilales bacterium]